MAGAEAAGLLAGALAAGLLLGAEVAAWATTQTLAATTINNATINLATFMILFLSYSPFRGESHGFMKNHVSEKIYRRPGVLSRAYLKIY